MRYESSLPERDDVLTCHNDGCSRGRAPVRFCGGVTCLRSRQGPGNLEKLEAERSDRAKLLPRVRPTGSAEGRAHFALCAVNVIRVPETRPFRSSLAMKRRS